MIRAALQFVSGAKWWLLAVTGLIVAIVGVVWAIYDAGGDARERKLTDAAKDSRIETLEGAKERRDDIENLDCGGVVDVLTGGVSTDCPGD